MLDQKFNVKLCFESGNPNTKLHTGARDGRGWEGGFDGRGWNGTEGMERREMGGEGWGLVERGMGCGRLGWAGRYMEVVGERRICNPPPPHWSFNL